MRVTVTDCHHRECCGCERPVGVMAEVIGLDGVTRYDLCEPHLFLLVREARRKGVVVKEFPAD